MATTLEFTGIDRAPMIGVLGVVHIPRSAFFGLLEQDLAGVFFNDYEFSEPVSFEVAGDSFSCRAIYDDPKASMGFGAESEYNSIRPQVMVRESQLVRRPTARNSFVTLRGVRYLIDDVLPDGVGVVTIYLKRR